MTVLSKKARKRSEKCHSCQSDLSELNEHPYMCDQCNENRATTYMPTIEQIWSQATEMRTANNEKMAGIPNHNRTMNSEFIPNVYSDRAGSRRGKVIH